MNGHNVWKQNCSAAPDEAIGYNIAYGQHKPTSRSVQKWQCSKNFSLENLK